MDNANQYLAPAAKQGDSKAYSDLACCYALMGRCKRSVEMIGKILDAAIENQHRVMFVDGAIAGGLVWSMAGMWSYGLDYLEMARKIAIKLGMEPRRARLCAHLVRFLAWKQLPDEASARYQEGMRITERLGMKATEWELKTAWGYALIRQDRSNEALPLLSEACDFFKQTGRLALLARARTKSIRG